MERRKPLRRKKALDRGKPLERGETPLKRTELERGSAPLQRKPTVKTDEERTLAHLWWEAVTRDPKTGRPKPCIVCGSRARIEGHHAIPKQTLKREARSQGVDPLTWVWEPAVGVPLCASDHANHTSGHRRVPGYRIPLVTWEWARSKGLEHHLEREHP